ncbi:MAG: hypothetical protein MJA84_15880 [Firmicutes bacterium]|nr:hypothetical protein [Bacillota bacterium]
MLKVKFSPGTQGYKKYGPEIEIEWQGGVIKDLIAQLAIETTEIGGVLVNHSHQGLNAKLADDSLVVFLPVACGG